MGGTWVALSNQPTFNAGHMILLTDGTVMTQDAGTFSWYKLVPDHTGHYAEGTWMQLQRSDTQFLNADGSRGYAPCGYASAVLADGRVFFAGGETNGTNDNSNTCGIYDPWSGSWKQVPTPPFGSFVIADAPCCVLPDGSFMVGASGAHEPVAGGAFVPGVATAYFDPINETWLAGPANPGTNWEASWALLPDGSVLCASVRYPTTSFRYLPYTGEDGKYQGETWVDAGSIPVDNDITGGTTETGPAMLLLDGTVVQFGATGHTAIYHPADSTWTAGPDFPEDPLSPLASTPADVKDGNRLKTYAASDAPAVLLPSGRVFGAMGPLPGGHSGPPTLFYEFVPPSGTAPASFEVVDSAPNNDVENEAFQLLLLPTGEVMATARSREVYIYRPDEVSATPPAGAAPVITESPDEVVPGPTSYVLTGTQLNGLSQANSFGDDASNATNYPIVRVQHNGTGKVVYGATRDHSTMGVATGDEEVSTNFTIPLGADWGPSKLTVIANGVASKPANVYVGLRPVVHQVSPSSIVLRGDGETAVTFNLIGENFEGHGGSPTLIVATDVDTLGVNPPTWRATAVGLIDTQLTFNLFLDPEAYPALAAGLTFPDGTRMAVPGQILVRMV
jgi:hypothetical protein